MARRRIVCWGELLWDLFPDGPRLGGAAANVAYHAAQLGADASLVSRVGDDELGARAIELLGASGVSTAAIATDPDHATGTVRVDVIDGEPHYSIQSDVAWDHISPNAAASMQLAAADAVCFGTLAQRTPSARGSLRSAIAGLEARCLRVCDLNLRPPHYDRDLVLAMLELSHVVKLNEPELVRLSDLAGVRDPLEWLLSKSELRLVALTAGSAGCRLVTRDATLSHPGMSIDRFPPPARGQSDSVGAGDAFTAALTLGLLDDHGLQTIAEAANYYAAWVASQPGAMPGPAPALETV